MNQDAAVELVAKLRVFVETLPDDERSLLAVLLATGIAELTADYGGEEVSLFSFTPPASPHVAMLREALVGSDLGALVGNEPADDAGD